MMDVLAGAECLASNSIELLQQLRDLADDGAR